MAEIETTNPTEYRKVDSVLCGSGGAVGMEIFLSHLWLSGLLHKRTYAPRKEAGTNCSHRSWLPSMLGS